MIQQTPFVRRQVRKLLLFICGSKEKYRQLRDLHTLDSHVRGIKKLLEEQGIFLRASVVTASSGSALQYDTLINLVRRAGAGLWLLKHPQPAQWPTRGGGSWPQGAYSLKLGCRGGQGTACVHCRKRGLGLVKQGLGLRSWGKGVLSFEKGKEGKVGRPLG